MEGGGTDILAQIAAQESGQVSRAKMRRENSVLLRRNIKYMKIYCEDQALRIKHWITSILQHVCMCECVRVCVCARCKIQAKKIIFLSLGAISTLLTIVVFSIHYRQKVNMSWRGMVWCEAWWQAEVHGDKNLRYRPLTQPRPWQWDSSLAGSLCDLWCWPTLVVQCPIKFYLQDIPRVQLQPPISPSNLMQ